MCVHLKCLQKNHFNKSLESILKDTHINIIFINKQQATSITFNFYNALANVLCLILMLAANTENYERNVTQLTNIKQA